jgi:hypothetical protein
LVEVVGGPGGVRLKLLHALHDVAAGFGKALMTSGCRNQRCAVETAIPTLAAAFSMLMLVMAVMKASSFLVFFSP